MNIKNTHTSFYWLSENLRRMSSLNRRMVENLRRMSSLNRRIAEILRRLYSE